MNLLPEIFSDSARRWPERVAVDVPPGYGRRHRTLLTYAQLDRAADALAANLRPLIHGECVVGILLPRVGPLLFSTQLAVLRAGAAYTCLDPAFPQQRVEEILGAADVRILLSDAAGCERLRTHGASGFMVLDVAAGRAAHGPDPEFTRAAAPEWLTPSSLAYVIYTSGTTGRPKGVMIEHRSIASLVRSDIDAFHLAPDARVAQGSSSAYDSSVEETWLAFAAGATLVVLDDETARSGPDLVPWLQRERISVFCPPPTLLRSTGCMDPARELPDLQLLYVGGEPLPRDLADRWAAGRLLVNGYGPTECTVTCVRGRIAAGEPVHIGTPVSGMTAWVLDESGHDVAPGVEGELWIGGIGVARGYWKEPQLTAERFIDHPERGRLYRTGDLVRCDAAGRYFHLGRADAQVKLRGYRIELGEIESRLAALPGVRAAACRVQGEGRDTLVAFVVPQNSGAPPDTDGIKQALARSLPGYMVPARIGLLEELPTTVGGKLDRTALPPLDPAATNADITTARNPTEMHLAAAFQEVLGLAQAVSVHADFFADLGGNSLKAAQLVSLLRLGTATASVTVRDVYDNRTVAGLAALARPADVRGRTQWQNSTPSAIRPMTVTIVQALWLMFLFVGASIVAGALAFQGLASSLHSVDLLHAVLLAPLLGLAAVLIYTPLSLLLAVLVKRALVGRYRAARVPVWSGLFLRHWLVRQVVSMVPWSLLSGTVLQIFALRALGARIGRRVHVHRNVDLQQGGWDLLDIGDDVTLGESSALRLVELDAGALVISPVTLGAGCTLETRASVAGHAQLEAGACLAALSSLPSEARIPRGERWDGVPAQPSGAAATRAALDEAAQELAPWQYALLLSLARIAIALLLLVPTEAAGILACVAFDLDMERVGQLMLRGNAGGKPWLVVLGLEVILVPLTLAWAAVVTRMLGAVREGTISRWSAAYARVWLKSGLVDGAGTWLSGTLLWPVWLRWAGMKVGRDCEISTIIDVVPELIEVGSGSFFADGIYLGGPRIHQGRVTLGRTTFGRNTFLGNHVVVAAGQHVPQGVLFGIATPVSAAVRPGSAWFGHPPFELPRREVRRMDRSLTHEPSLLRYGSRVFWETLRFALPVLPLLVVIGWLRVLAVAAAGLSTASFLLVAVPLVTLAAAMIPCLSILVLKWVLLGRVKSGEHALWSCWCSRWDFLYVAWGQYARPALQKLEGTLLLHWFLRAMGMRIGRRVVLGSGFSQVVDPDMIELDDDSTVNAMFQAHTFEDRVLKIDRVIVGRGATLGFATVPLYGVRVGEGTHVAAHSVMMKGEQLSPGLNYEGAPIREC